VIKIDEDTNMIQDQLLMKAVSGIRQHSEKQQDIQKLLESFVDIGILTQIANVNNQIIYGRRGTGKTHILKVLATRLKEEKENAVIYIDARTLGSTSQFSDSAISLKQDVWLYLEIYLVKYTMVYSTI